MSTQSNKRIEILEHRAEEAELQSAQADALFNSIGDGAVKIDESGRIAKINQAALELLGFNEGDVLGEWFPGVIIAESENGDEIPTIERPATKAFISGKPTSAKLFYRRKDGNNLPVMVTVSPIIWEGKPIGAIEVFRDFSREYEIDKMKSEFISLASHQLRTPLSAVHMYTNMLVEGYAGPLNERQQRYADTVLTSSRRMNELINTLLNIASIEGGGIAIASKPTDLAALINDVCSESRHNAELKNIRIRLLCDNIPKIYTDPVLVKEIVGNLFTNAIKYTPKGGKITMQLHKKSDEVTICVRDSGMGIPLNEQNKIFSKFYRASNIVKGETTGTGLGLYMAQGVARNLGGKIWFESVEGKGTTFYLSLPARMLEGLMNHPVAVPPPKKMLKTTKRNN